jgi:hypothetical protein
VFSIAHVSIVGELFGSKFAIMRKLLAVTLVGRVNGNQSRKDGSNRDKHLARVKTSTPSSDMHDGGRVVFDC